MHARQTELILALHRIGAIQFGLFQLKSGQTSTIYLNLRKIISHPQILRDVANLIIETIMPRHVDLLCGVPYTALPIATCVSLMSEIPLVIRRKEKKNYGTKQLIEGDFKPQQSCLVIEDVITTGSSIIETVTDLEEAGLTVKELVVLVDREQDGRKNLEPRFTVHTILTLSTILNTLLNSTVLSPAERDNITAYLRDAVP